MAQKVAVATGLWSAAGTWDSVPNTPTLHASTNVTINATARFTATFTAPNTINACTGVLLFITAVGTGGTVTVTLQESTVDTAAAQTLNITSLPVGDYVYFRFPTPYVYTTTGAGAYRFKIQAASPAGTTNAAADSGGTLYYFWATDDRTGVPASTDDVIIPKANLVTPITVTLDGTQTIGNGANITGLARRSFGNAVVIVGSLLTWDTAASATLTAKGNILASLGGELRAGTPGTPYPAAFVASLLFNENGTGGNYGLETYTGGKFTPQGTPKSSTSLWKTKYVSGLGTAASPLVTLDAVDWDVGDEILVGATGNAATNYNETENKFIRVKNSSTSYTLADTAGGAESALANTHTTDAWILNVQRNVIIKSTTTTEGCYYYNENSTAGDVDIDWTRFETTGSPGNTLKDGISIVGLALATAACDYSVCYRAIRRGFVAQASKEALTFTGLIGCNQNAPSATGVVSVTQRANNKTLIDCFAIKNNRAGIEISLSNNLTFTRCVAISNNTVGSVPPTGTGGFSFNQAALITLDDCEAHCNRNIGVSFSNSVAKAKFTNFLCGTKGVNTLDLHVIADLYADMTFINSTFSSATFVSSGYLSLVEGSEIRFQTLNGTVNNHIWYTNNGIARNAGAGLVDTTTKTAGNFAVRLAPENATTGLFWDFLIGISANSAASVFGFIQKNAAFGTDVVTVELFLPGSTVADASQTMGNTTGTWLVFSMAAAYNGSVAAFARVRITAKTVTAAAYVYVADLYNGTNVLTSFKAWNDGKPSPVFTDLLGDPASVWAILDVTLTTPGTTGYDLVQILNRVEQYLDASVADVEADTQDIQTRIPAALTAGGNIKADILMIEGVDATNQIRDAILTDATRFAGANIDAAISSRATPAQVNTEVVDVLTIDTFAESAGVPAATASIKDKIAWLATLARNKITQTATTQALRNDGDSGNVGTAGVSDDGTTATRNKWS